MPREAIVAVFRTEAEATEAAAAIRGAGFETASVRVFDAQHPAWGGVTTQAPPPDSSFWDMLFHGSTAADESSEHGGTVLSVVAGPADVEAVLEVLNDLGPMELDQRTEDV